MGMFEKFFRRKEPDREEQLSDSPIVERKYQSSPEEVVLSSQEFEREEVIDAGISGDTRFIKIKDDGGVFSSPMLGLKTNPISDPVL